MKKFTYIVSVLMFIGGLLMQMYPDALPPDNLGNYFGAVFVIMSVFVLDNVKIKELQDKTEKLEEEIRKVKNKMLE